MSIAKIFVNKNNNILYMGDFKSIKLSSKLNIKYIYNLSGFEPFISPDLENVKIYRIILDDKPLKTSDKKYYLSYLKSHVDNITNDLNKGNVLVNCAAGLNRSGLLVGLYLREHIKNPVEIIRNANRLQREVEALVNEDFVDIIEHFK